MVLKDFPPASAVSSIVQCYRIVDLDFSNLPKIPVKTYPPKPENCLHFCLEGNIQIKYSGGPYDVYSEPVLVGQQTYPFERISTLRVINFQIVFQPTALHQLFGIHSAELTNKHVDAISIFGPEINSVKQQLQDASSYLEMISIADSFTCTLNKKRIKQSNRLDLATQKLMRDGSIGMDDLAEHLCLGTKQLKRIFSDATGINPKTFQRIARFNKAYNLKNRFQELDWLSISLKCGYYDYTHLVKDYRDFTGLSPNNFHVLEQVSPERVLGLATDLYKSRFTENVF